MKLSTIKVLSLIWIVGLLFSVPLRAQVAGATLSGTVTDVQGGFIAGAKVSAKDASTGVTTETTTNSSGVYTIVNLHPASYDVSVSATGFSTAVSKVTLTVGAQQLMNISLAVGQISQVVEVTGAAAAIEMANATLSGNIQSMQIVELPLNGRDWASLATLEPGVVSVRPHEQVTQPGGNLRGLGNQMSIDGNRPTQNVYRLNGVIVNDYSNAGPGNVLGASVGVDAIQEFTVLTSNYSAEYGFTSGGVITAVTKSGTNQFHGSAYEFLRNAALDSSNYIDGPNKGHFTRNQFGGSGGWRIIKNKVFIFGGYEGLRQRKGIPSSAFVITQNARNGILNDDNGNPLPALPSNTVCPYPNMTLHPGGAICVDNFTYSFVNALDPLPNGPNVGPDNNTGVFTFSSPQAVTDNYFTMRTDIRISDKDSVNSSYYRDHSSWITPGALNDSTSGILLPNQSASLEENHVFSPAMVNSVRFGYTQSNVTNPNIAAINAKLLDPQYGITSTLGAPAVAGQGGAGSGAGISGVTTFGGYNKESAGWSDWVQNYQVFDDASRTIGKHTVKFGFEFIRNHTDILNENLNGSAAFTSMAGFLQNEPMTIRMPTSPPFTAGNTKHYNRNSVFGGYVQDDWKTRPSLTLNVGLRYEMSTIPYEINGKFEILPTLWTDPGNCVADINGLPIASTCSALRKSVFAKNPTFKNFEPRVGFAWDPFHSGKTSVRGGFGMFDVLPMPYMFGLNATQSSPAGAEVDLTNPIDCYSSGTPCPIPQGSFVKGLPAAVAGLSAAGSGRWQYTEANPRRNYVMQWNANVQREITTNTTVTVAYAGSRGIHNPFQTDTLNTCYPTKTSAGWLFPTPIGSCVYNTNPTGIVPGQMVNPFIPGLIQSTIDQAQSWYKSLQVNFAKKMSHGLQYEVSFTWQHSTDTSSGSFAGDNYSSNPTAAIPWWDLSITKGKSDFNISRNLTVNWLYQIPTPASFSGPAGWIARGWAVGGLLELSDGVPMWPLGGLTSDPLGQLNSEPMSIPDLAAGCTPQNAVQPGNLQYLKPQCFIIPLAPNQAFATANCDQNPPYGPNGTRVPLASLGVSPLTCFNLLGHLPRNSIIGPGLFNVDMDFVKDNHIKKFSEEFNIQFRAEFFNILNHTNYAPPTNTLNVLDPFPVGGFGVINQPTQVPMREIQFALKVIW